MDRLVELALQGGAFVGAFMTFMFFWLLRRYDREQEATRKREELTTEALRANTAALNEFNSIFRVIEKRPRR